ncbi:MAG: hypothetical protein V1861_01260 [Candidatus Micrarchaeota archaeon]
MVLVGRTPLLLAFGEHPAECGGVRYGADKKFFQSAVVPFLEEHVERRGGKAAIIFEFNVGFNLLGFDRDNPAHARAVQKMVAEHEMDMVGKVTPKLNGGMEIGPAAEWFDWGYLDKVIAINAMKPNSVLSIVEPLGADTAWSMWDQETVMATLRNADSFMEKVKIEKEIIRYSARTCIGRSRRVADLAQRIRREDPAIALIIPRGYAHSGMASFFSPADFDVTLLSHMRGASRFSSDIIIEAFAREVSDDEWTRHAALALHFNAYCSANGERFMNASKKNGSYDEDVLRLLSVEAKRYALDLEGRGELYSDRNDSAAHKRRCADSSL